VVASTAVTKPPPARARRTPRPLHRLADPVALARERRALIDAALELLRDEDTLELHVGAIVKRAGQHREAFYRIFGSKAGLMFAVLEEAVQRTVDALDRHMARATSPTDGVHTWAEVLLKRAASPRAAAAARPFALDRHHILDQFPGAAKALDQPIRLRLARVLQSADLPDADRLAAAAYELVMGSQATWIATGHRPTPTEIDRYAAMVVRLVGAA
jgi:AcrR family transcriptional regulator